MLSNHPDLQQMHFAFVLRNAQVGPLNDSSNTSNGSIKHEIGVVERVFRASSITLTRRPMRMRLTTSDSLLRQPVLVNLMSHRNVQNLRDRDKIGP